MINVTITVLVSSLKRTLPCRHYPSVIEICVKMWCHVWMDNGKFQTVQLINLVFHTIKLPEFAAIVKVYMSLIINHLRPVPT